MKKKSDKITEVLQIAISIIMLITVAYIGIVACMRNISHTNNYDISGGTVVYKEYIPGKMHRGKNGAVYEPEKYQLTISTLTNGETKMFIIDVPEGEFYIYNLGDEYPKGT